jgi:hypothetical protein
MADPKVAVPKFEEITVEANLSDGYWIDAVDIDGDGKPDLIASGLAEGNVVWYQNPGWKKRTIAKFDKPVSLHHTDIDGDGHIDLVLGHDYGNCMFGCRPQDGRISWLRNPGPDGLEAEWERHPVGDLLATHRLRFGHFTSPDRMQLMALPVVGPQGGPEGVHSPIRMTLFDIPPDPANATEWPRTVVNDQDYRIIHGVIQQRFGEASAEGVESLLLASAGGISWFFYGKDGAWHIKRFGEGETTQFAKTGFKGSGNIDIGRIGDDHCAYIATLEPFHGNTVAVYTKTSGTGLENSTWKRTVLDTFADPNERGEGPGHHVVTADFDGDGEDEFLVALRGPWPWQGVYYYKAIDAPNGLFVKTRVSNFSAARICVADFDGDGRLDFATTGYYTPGYFLADDPRVMLFLNRIETR